MYLESTLRHSSMRFGTRGRDDLTALPLPPPTYTPTKVSVTRLRERCRAKYKRMPCFVTDFPFMDCHNLQQTAAAVAAVSVVYALYRRYNRPSLKDIPGPPSPSWVFGD
jgi:hypothetical protein